MKTIGETILIAAIAALTCAPVFAEQRGSKNAPPPEVDPLKAGVKAPNFNRVTTAGKKISLKQFRGMPVILYFYPKDETPQCTKEACSFRNFYNKLKPSEVEIIGVSSDNDDSHTAFASHHNLPFDLISDTDDSLLRMYHVPRIKETLHKRVTFVIDKEGIIRSTISYTNDGDAHVREAIAALKQIGVNAAELTSDFASDKTPSGTDNTTPGASKAPTDNIRVVPIAH